MPSYQKLQCRLSAPYILVACDGGLQRKKINTDDHLSMCSCSGGTELDKAAKFRISRSAWCTFSRGEQIRGYVHRENEHRGAHFRGWCTNSLANLCAGARLRGGERIRCYTGNLMGRATQRETNFLNCSLTLVSLNAYTHLQGFHRMGTVVVSLIFTLQIDQNGPYSPKGKMAAAYPPVV